MTKDEALRLALEALTNAYWPTESDLMPTHNIKECAEAITAIKEALANEALDKMAENARELGLDYEPAQRTWVGLTEDEVFAVSNTMPYADRFDFAEAIEAKLKEKNT
jgi:hypothetical protein